MLAVVEDQVSQVLLFQFFIGDAVVMPGQYVVLEIVREFQFSIGDAAGKARHTSFRVKTVSILYWRC